MVDSINENDPSLPIDFDQSSTFVNYLNQAERFNDFSMLDSPKPKRPESFLASSTDSRGGREKMKKSGRASQEHSPERPLSRGGTVREQENIISELKKECFGLKLRIYYMEEHLRETFDVSTEDVFKKNVELKVEVEELKNDISYKTDLLTKASQAMEQMSAGNLAEEKDSDQIKKLEDEIDLLNEKLAEKEKEEYRGNDLKKLIGQKDERYRLLEVKKQEDEDSLKAMICELEQTVTTKESNIEMLRNDLRRLASNSSMNTSTDRSNQHYKTLYERASKELEERDNALHLLQTEVTNKSSLGQSFKDHIASLEKSLKGMRETTHEKELELQKSIKQLELQVKKLQTSCEEKDEELEEKDKALTEAKEEHLLAHQKRVQYELDSVKNKDSQIIELEIKVKQQEFDLGKLKSLLEEKEKDIAHVSDLKEKTEEELISLQKNYTEENRLLKDEHLQANRDVDDKIMRLQGICDELQERLHFQNSHQDKVVKQLTTSLIEKDNTIENLLQLLRKSEDGFEKEVNPLFEKMKKQLTDKDKIMQKYIEEHNTELSTKDEAITSVKRLLKGKENNLLKVEGLYAVAQQEIKRLKGGEKEFARVVTELKNSLEKSMEKERVLEKKSSESASQTGSSIEKFTKLLQLKDQEIQSLHSQLDSLLSKPTELNALDKVSDNLMKSLQQQVKEKDVQMEEIKAMKEEATSAALLKQQELLALIKEKEEKIMDLKKTLTAKEEESSSTLDELNLKVSANDAKVKNLSSALLEAKNASVLEVQTLWHTLNEKDDVIQALSKTLQDKDISISKMATFSDDLLQKNQMVETLSNQMEELKVSLELLQNEKSNIEIQYKTMKITKESQEKQLQAAYNKLTKKKVDAELQESALTCELGDLAKVFETLINSYKLFMEKLINNQHPESQLRVLQHEITEVQHTRDDFQLLLSVVLNKLPNKASGADINLQKILNENKTLKIHLEESKTWNASLEGRLKALDEKMNSRENSMEYQKENETLKEDMERFKMNAEVVNEQVIKTKLEHEQLVCERDKQILNLRKKLEQDKKVIELLTQQISSANKQLNENHKKISEDIAKLENAQKHLVEKSREKVVLQGLLDDKENTISKLQNEMSLLQNENRDLAIELGNEQRNLESTNGTIDQLKIDLQAADDNITTLETRLSTSVNAINEEKKTLKRDVKELYEMNVRLRKKLKAYELVIGKKDTEKGKLTDELERAKDTITNLEELLNNSNGKTALEGELQHLRIKLRDFKLVNERYKSLQSENAEMQGKLDEVLKINNLHEQTTLPEIQKLRERIDNLTEENTNSKMQLDKINKDHDLVVQKQHEELEEKTQENHNLQTIVEKQCKGLEEKSLENNKLQNIVEKRLKEIGEKSSSNTNLQDMLQKQYEDLEEKENRIKKLLSDLQRINECLKESKLMTEKLSCELIESKSLIDSLQGGAALNSSDQHEEVVKLKEEIKHLKEAKLQLKEKNRKLKESGEEINGKLSMTLGENNAKLEEIKVLKTQMIHLEEKIESFSPLYTSSAHNIALSSDAFTQTQGQNSASSITESNDSIILQHIKEMQQLRKQLEETINNNNSLRMQLEERLNQVEEDVSMIHDPQLRISLIRDNDAMRLKLGEHDVTRKKLRIQINELNEEKVRDKETINSLQSQMHELNVIATNLKMEMEVYDRLIQQLGINRNKQNNNKGACNTSTPNNPNDLDKNLLLALLEEIKDLREQLQLTVDVNNSLREKLEKELGHPVPIPPGAATPRKPRMSPRSLFSDVLRSVNTNTTTDRSIAENTQSLADYTSLDETPTKDQGIDVTLAPSSYYSYNNTKTLRSPDDDCVICGKAKDLKMLKQITATILDKVSTCFKKLKSHKENSVKVMTDMVQIQKLLKELSKVLSTFIISQSKQTDIEAENKQLREELACVKEVLACSENTISPFQDLNTTEFDLATKLMKACDTLKTTKGNLQLKTSKPPSRNASPS